MKYVVAGGTHSRIEDGQAVVYKMGDTISLSADEVKAFPGKFTPLALPQSEIDEQRDSESRAEVAKLEGQVTTLTGERDTARKAAEDLQDDLDSAEGENTRLMAENADLKRQLAEKQPPVSDPALKVNPAEGEDAAPTATDAVNDGDKATNTDESTTSQPSASQTSTSKKK